MQYMRHATHSRRFYSSMIRIGELKMPSDIHAHAHGHTTISHMGAAAKPLAQNQQINAAMAVGANTATAANSKGAKTKGQRAPKGGAKMGKSMVEVGKI